MRLTCYVAVEEEKKEKEKEMLRGLEERATSNAKWSTFAKNIKKDEESITAGSGNVRNESTAEVG